jgi:hypothetical protein
MSLQEFIASPWKESHEHFKKSVFNISPAPEFSTGEVVLSALYRASGLKGLSERQVKGFGDELSKLADKAKKKDANAEEIQPDTWRTVLDRVIQSPKVAQQSSKRFMSLSPVVPEAARYSGAARLTGNPWNPGELIQRIILMGGQAADRGPLAWASIHEALAVSPTDDIWARWLQGEFERRLPSGAVAWAPNELATLNGLPYADRPLFAFPAKQFLSDLEGIIAAKPMMTRRQWISLLEAVLRIGTVSHVLWLCDVNDRIWNTARRLIEQPDSLAPTDRREAAYSLLEVNRRMLPFGNPAIPVLRDFASKYLSARLGLNLVLWQLEEFKVQVAPLDSVDNLLAFFRTIEAQRGRLSAEGVIATYHEINDRETRTITCKKGIGSNLVEFSQYTLGQRQTMDEALRGYDQGYFLRKRGEARNSPWVLALGPAAVLAMAHCCLHEVRGPRSVQRLAMHMANYGIEFDLHELNESDLGHQLRMLGLVLDSPDAESGMLLVPPFAT